MTYDEDELGRLLEQTLRIEGDAIQPIGDGLQQIRTTIGRRRSRLRWTLPVAGVAAAAAVATVAFAVLGPHNNALQQVQPALPSTTTPTATTATAAPTGTQTGEPTGGPTPVPSAIVVGIWPYATDADAKAWPASSSMPWAGNAKLVAQKFVTAFGGTLGSDVTAEGVLDEPGGTVAVTVSRKLDNGPTVTVAVVHERQWTSGAWSVTTVTAANRGFTNLEPGATLAQQGQEIRGIHHAEDAYAVSVYEAGGTKPLGMARSAAVDDKEWAASPSFATSASMGSVVAVDGSLADGGIGAMIAVPVFFGAPLPVPTLTATPTTLSPSDVASGLPGFMTTFVGVKDGRIAIFGTTSGRLVSYLTDKQPGGGDSTPSMSTDRSWVYFLRGTGTCANEIDRIPFPGGNESQVEKVAAPQKGFAYAAMSAGSAGQVAFIEDSCNGDGVKFFGWEINGGGNGALIPAGPPTVVGTPRFSPDGKKVAFFIKTGTAQHIAAFDVAKPIKGLDSGDASVCQAPEACGGIDFDWAPDGSFVILKDPSILVRVDAGSTKEIPLHGSEGTLGTTIDLSKDGSGLLVWDPQNNRGTYFTVEHDRAVPSDVAYVKYEAPGTW